MSTARRRLVTRIEDLTLGAFSNVQPSDTLNHLIRYLSTWNGSDKLFMLCATEVAERSLIKLIQYGAKVLIPILQARARLQHRAGLRNEPASSIAPKLAKLAGMIGDARTLWGLWGMLPIIQWLISLERTPPPTRRLLTIERTQGWSMLAFYPLQHLSYFRRHDIIPATLPLPAGLPLQSSGKPRRVAINVPAISQWASRLWATYIVLQLAHLREDRTLLIKKHRALSRLNSVEKERAELAGRWDRWYNELAVNLSFLPMTIHWSLEKGLFKNDTWISLFGLAAAIASFRNGWKATALPPSNPSTEPTAPEAEAEDTSRIPEKQQGSTTNIGYETK